MLKGIDQNLEKYLKNVYKVKNLLRLKVIIGLQINNLKKITKVELQLLQKSLLFEYSLAPPIVTETQERRSQQTIEKIVPRFASSIVLSSRSRRPSHVPRPLNRI